MGDAPRIEFFEVRGPRWQPELCARIESSFVAGQRVYLLADSEGGARFFDELLWTFRDESFVPHALWQGEDTMPEPVAVGWREGNPNRAHCLVLARQSAPDRVDGFDQVIDLAPVDIPELRDDARARFREFQGRGLQPLFHRAPPSP